MNLIRSPGVKFTPRLNPAAADWTQATLNTDGNWHTLSLTSIIPANAKLVLLHLNASSYAVGGKLRIRTVGASNGFDEDEASVMVANKNNLKTSLIVPIAGAIDYAITTATGYSCQLTVSGWFV